MSTSPSQHEIDLPALGRSLSGKERELSRLARELLERGRAGGVDGEAWFALVEQAVVSLRRLARDLEAPASGTKQPAPDEKSKAPAGDLPAERKPAPIPMEERPLSSSSGVLAGHASVVPVSEMLGFLSGLGKSGVLWVETEKEGFLVQLESGSVVYAQGDSPPKGQRLGEILMRNGAISKQHLEQAIQDATGQLTVLGEYLMREKLITRTDLARALSEQAQQIFDRMFTAVDASYQFEDKQRMVDSEDVRLNVIQLLLESARANDEARSLFESQLGFPIGPSVAEDVESGIEAR